MKELSDFIFKHDFVKDAIFNIFKRVRVFVKKEAPPMNFLSNPLDGRSTFGSADIDVMCTDVQEENMIVGFDWGFTTCEIEVMGFFHHLRDWGSTLLR